MQSKSPKGPPFNDKIDYESKVEIPFSAYEKIKGKPYSVEYFDIVEWTLLDDETDVDNKREKVKTIEEFIKHEIRNKNLNDSISSFKELLNKYKAELNISENEKESSKLERLYLYLKLIKKQRDLDKKRQEIIGGIVNAK